MRLCLENKKMPRSRHFGVDLFTQTPEAKLRGYDKGRFSFNVRGGL